MMELGHRGFLALGPGLSGRGIRQGPDHLGVHLDALQEYPLVQVLVVVKPRPRHQAVRMFYNAQGGLICSHLGFEILRNFAEILRSVAILRSRFCRDFEKFAVNLPTPKFF